MTVGFSSVVRDDLLLLLLLVLLLLNLLIVVCVSPSRTLLSGPSSLKVSRLSDVGEEIVQILVCRARHCLVLDRKGMVSFISL